MTANPVSWTDEIGCEGGPIVVANIEDFKRWRGAEHFDASEATELHYWSPFTAELPERWHANGTTGHQYIPDADPGALRDDLIATVLERWPQTRIDRGGSTWRAIRPDGRVLHAALWPDSEYDRMCRGLEAEGIYGFDQGASGYFWSVSPGMVRIDVDKARDQLLLSQVEYADDDDDVREAYDFMLGAQGDAPPPGVQYRVTSGPVVVAWSPNSGRDMPAHASGSGLTSAQPGVLLDLSTDSSAALLWLEPGLYASSHGYHGHDRWAVAWCRLRRVG